MNIEDKYKVILERFKVDTKDLLDGALSDIYCDYLPYVENDTTCNIAIKTQDVIESIIAGKFTRGNNCVTVRSSDGVSIEIKMTSNEYDNIRKSLIEIMPECPKDLEIESLKKTIECLTESNRSYY